jgi:hypothetical protein
MDYYCFTHIILNTNNDMLSHPKDPQGMCAVG